MWWSTVFTGKVKEKVKFVIKKQRISKSIGVSVETLWYWGLYCLLPVLILRVILFCYLKLYHPANPNLIDTPVSVTLNWCIFLREKNISSTILFIKGIKKICMLCRLYDLKASWAIFHRPGQVVFLGLKGLMGHRPGQVVYLGLEGQDQRQFWAELVEVEINWGAERETKIILARDFNISPERKTFF